MSNLADKAAAAVAQRNATTQQQVEKPTLAAQLNAPWVTEQVQKQLGPGFDAGSYVRSVISAVKAAPQLGDCDPGTVFGAMFTAAQLHLEIGSGLGQAWIIPRQEWKNRNDPKKYFGWQASLQIGYQGLLKLAYNTGLVTGVDTEIVRVGDKFKRGANSERGKFYDLEYGADHENPETQIMGIIGMFWVRGSSRPVWRYLTIDEIERRRPEHTKERDGQNGPYVPAGPWKSDYQAMAEKTAVIHALKFAPKTPHLALAMSVDDMALTVAPEAPSEVRLEREGQKPEIVNLDEAAADAAAEARQQ